MEKRLYTHINKIGKEIDQMIKEGKTQRDIAAFFGFKDKEGCYSSISEAATQKKRTSNGRNFTQTTWTST